MRKMCRSVKFKSVLMIALGAALIVVQFLSALGWKISDQGPEYGTGVSSVGIFIGTWIFLIVGVLSLGFGIAAVKKNRLIRGTSIILTLAMGVSALAAMTLSSSVVLHSSGWQEYTLYATGLHYIFAILAVLTCGPISMVVVALAFPYCFFTGRIYEFLYPASHEYLYFYISTLVSLFVIPSVWALVTNQFARGGGWKRFCVGLAVGYCDLIAIRSCFSMLGISLMPAISMDAEWGVPIIAVCCAAIITIVSLWLFSRYDKKHQINEAFTTTSTYIDDDIHRNTPTQSCAPQILFCRKCGARLPLNSTICSRCGMMAVSASEGAETK